MELATRKMVMELTGTIVSVDKTKPFTNGTTGEITPSAYKIVFLENIGTEENPKTQSTSVKVKEITMQNETQLTKLVMKKVFVQNIVFGKYQDNNGAYQDWFNCELKDIKLLDK